MTVTTITTITLGLGVVMTVTFVMVIFSRVKRRSRICGRGSIESRGPRRYTVH